MRTAKAWRLTPAQWRAQSVDDRALMLALGLFENTREAYREEFMESARSKVKGTGPGINPLQAMKAKMGL